MREKIACKTCRYRDKCKDLTPLIKIPTFPDRPRMDICEEQLKEADQILALFREEIEKLGVISDEEIRLSCLGEGNYYAGERDEAATENPPVLMPQFRRVSQTQLQDSKDTLLRME